MIRSSAHRFRRGVIVAAVAAAAALAGVAPANAEPFHGSNMVRSFTEWSSTWSRGPQYWPGLPAGRAVLMRCWDTGAYVDGTAKWFKVQDTNYPYTTGFVPANDVGFQWQSSPHC